jgi:hypothetical protein
MELADAVLVGTNAVLVGTNTVLVGTNAVLDLANDVLDVAATSSSGGDFNFPLVSGPVLPLRSNARISLSSTVSNSSEVLREVVLVS